MPIPRQALAARLAHQTVMILEARGYVADSGKRVDLTAALELAVQSTETYPPERVPRMPDRGPHATGISVENAAVLEVAGRLARRGRVAVLNFASALEPGGGFLRGACAQEESIARASGLFACLEGTPMYDYHRARGDNLYADWVIYSPDVPVFRDGDDELIEEPWPCSILTSPAPYAEALRRWQPELLPQVEPALRARIAKVLAVGILHGHEAIVLGAWGCGAFGNEPSLVASLFDEALAGPFAGVFREVVFAIIDNRPERRIIGPFEDRFGLARRVAGPGRSE